MNPAHHPRHWPLLIGITRQSPGVGAGVADRKTLIKLGTPPVLMRMGKLELRLTDANAAAMKLYAPGFDGTRREELPLDAVNGTLRISVDTGNLKDGPTPFFELTASTDLPTKE